MMSPSFHVVLYQQMQYNAFISILLFAKHFVEEGTLELPSLSRQIQDFASMPMPLDNLKYDKQN